MPTATTRKIFYNKPVLCTNRRSIFVSARGSPTAVSTSTTAASVAVAVAIAARAPGVLHDHALAAELLAVQLVNGVVGVAGVLELHEAVPIFEVYFEEAAIAAEKALDVLLPDVVAQASYVDARHVRGGRGPEGWLSDGGQQGSSRGAGAGTARARTRASHRSGGRVQPHNGVRACQSYAIWAAGGGAGA